MDADLVSLDYIHAAHLLDEGPSEQAQRHDTICPGTFSGLFKVSIFEIICIRHLKNL